MRNIVLCVRIISVPRLLRIPAFKRCKTEASNLADSAVARIGETRLSQKLVIKRRELKLTRSGKPVLKEKLHRY